MAQVRTIHKTGPILSEGSEQQYIYYIHQGYAREYNTIFDSGEEVTTWFWSTGDFIFHPGFFSGKSSEVFIDFYNGGTYVEISFKSLIELSKHFDEVCELAENLRIFIDRQHRIHQSDLASLNRIDHVKKMYYAHKQLFNFVRHKDIASFLGIRDRSIYRYLKNL